MSDFRKIMQGRQVSSYSASQQFRAGNNAAINGFSASSRTEKTAQNFKTGNENLSKSLHSEARAYERSGWQQEKLYQISNKKKLLGNN